ncbi:MAG: anthranilate phosphoribosyltransferase [Alphaproteobacteria bacterium]|nr:anthranilate phosphoribosyltransferase [Alphaproteobacteria bacterium]
MKDLLQQLLDGRDLTATQADRLLVGLTADDTNDVVRAALLVALAAKGETGEELYGMAMAMRRAAVRVPVPDGLAVVDTCGTGGDGSGSFNVSTAAAIVVAAAGVPVVKHGNRSVSSKCGSADVLEAMGVPLATSPYEARAQLVDTGFTFLFAPAFHPATAAVSPVRRQLGVRTAFNLLGPLSNPAAPRFQLVGAYSAGAARKLAAALSRMPITRAFVVHGMPSWDEATPCGPFLKLDVHPGKVDEAFVDPQMLYDMPRAAPEALAGGDAETNARIMSDLFSGVRSPVRDAVVLNAALVFELVGRAAGPEEARALAEDVIDGGRVTWFLARVGSRS